MKKSKREYWLFIQDISFCMQRILNYTEGMDLDTFESDQLRIDATLRNFTILGEAAANIPENIKEKYPNIQ